MLLIKNTNLYSPTFLGKKDILISNGKIVAIEDEITKHNVFSEDWDAHGSVYYTHLRAQETTEHLVWRSVV